MSLNLKNSSVPPHKNPKRVWLYRIVLIYILLFGAYLRFVGLDWDEEQHLHPDERFLTMVESAIQLPGLKSDSLGLPPSVTTQEWRKNYVEIIPDCDEWGGYFDTACSPLNPNNRGYDYYVYGTLPIFIVRYAAELSNKVGYGEIYLVGRALSAVSDLLVICLVYAIASKIYSEKVAVLAAAFSAFSVLPIQQSHFFTVDTFTNFFMMLAIYFAVTIAAYTPQLDDLHSVPETYPEITGWNPKRFLIEIRKYTSNPIFLPSIAYGISLGMAVASKINAAPLAIILPVAVIIYLFRFSGKERETQAFQIFLNLLIAALVSLLVFRVFQPYAFTGPGYFGIKPNRAWIDDLSSLKAQTGGDVDFPPALQWARRPIWFSLQNMVLWGLGLPLGLLSWIGFAVIGLKIFTGDFKKHGLLWGWTALYFIWQSIQWNSTMRYQLPIYPLMPVFAAWFIFFLWEKAKRISVSRFDFRRIIVIFIGASVLALTAAWAFAFSRIYIEPHPRVEASRWMFQNIPGPVNLSILSDGISVRQPLPFSQNTQITPDSPHQINFTPQVDGKLVELEFPHIVDNEYFNNASLILNIISPEESIIGTEIISNDDIKNEQGERNHYQFSEPVAFFQGDFLSFEMNLIDETGEILVCGPINIDYLIEGSQESFQVTTLSGCVHSKDFPLQFVFPADTNGVIQSISMDVEILQKEIIPSDKRLFVEIREPGGDVLGRGEIISDFIPSFSGRGKPYIIPISGNVLINKGTSYSIKYSVSSDVGAISFSGSAIVNESSWDDGLPLRIDGYDPYGGIYLGGLNFEMYWDDNQEKYERFVSNLNNGDYILITSSRQWGSTSRVEERYPLTNEYYRQLIGCPDRKTIEWCYNVAEPGKFSGNLGFELDRVFQSKPALGTFQVNDQFAEEAFTVYDHPKVFVFRKLESFDSKHVQEILGSVDLSKVIRVTPKQADSHPGDLQLPRVRLEEQKAGGTWSELFNTNSLINRVQILGVVLWYFSVALLGLIVYPIIRYALPGLSDNGYPISRIAGLLFLSVFVWLAASFRIPFQRSTIGAVLIGLSLFGCILGYVQREGLRKEIKTNKKYYFLIEGIFLLFFVIGLLIRFGNPDLWHPWKGGEKPMDFSYFNAVLKSTSFPPYDPWFSGGYINYYYYGFMLVGVLVKFLGIVPSFAYNLILPTLLAMIAIGAYSVVWNLLSSNRNWQSLSGEATANLNDIEIGTKLPGFPKKANLIASFSGAVLMAILGNLGILQMFSKGLQKAASPGGEFDTAGFFMKLYWTFKGFYKSFTGTPIPIRMDEWYWNPSRVISHEHGSPITEFPFFTFLYGDLHAHLIALPVALLVIAWVISVIRGRAWLISGKRNWVQISFGFIVGSIAIGAMYPINLSDIYTYFPLGAIALIYAILRYADNAFSINQIKSSKTIIRILKVVIAVGFLFALTNLFYLPYSKWYGQGYDEVKIWDGTHTPLSQYIIHWGFFLFILISWMFYETIDWMRSTPLSQLRKLEPYKGVIWSGLFILITLLLILGINLYPGGLPPDKLPLGLGIHIVWLVFPLAVWAGVLTLRPGMSDPKRIVLFFIGTGFLLTLMVEIIVVSGDIGRMNTVFKFYLHTWTLFSVSSGAALGWLLMTLPGWKLQQRTIWQLCLGFLVFSTALYPLLGSIAKINDRIETTASHSLDGMEYMMYSTYHDEGTEMVLSQDYSAIRWMQENIDGSPVIVEANSVEYHWGTRYTIYTGLPGVVGWNWHQRQQRNITPHDWVFERVDSVHEFYQTEDLDWVTAFLSRYDVKYIIVGQLERAKYPGPGLDKFQIQEGVLWQTVFIDRDTVIYEVMNIQ